MHYKRGSEWPSDRRNIHALLHNNTLNLKPQQISVWPHERTKLCLNQGNLGMAYSLAHNEYTPRSYSGGPGFEYLPRGQGIPIFAGFF